MLVDTQYWSKPNEVTSFDFFQWIILFVYFKLSFIVFFKIQFKGRYKKLKIDKE